jgi:hypothetical protein
MALAAAVAAGPFDVQLPSDGRPHEVRVTLSPEEWRALAAAGPASWAAALSVRTSPDAALPAVAGTHVAADGALRFHPRFPFVSGVRYVARFTWGGRHREHAFEVAPSAAVAPQVVGVFPSSPVVPENTLRLYVQFSRPMRARGVHDHVQLVDDETGPVPLAFVEVPDGLWDPAQTRLTLFFHPGRVKRGVAPGEALGPPLRAGRSYRLVVEGGLRDAAGVPLGATFEHAFRVAEPDRTPPRAGALRLTPPRSSREAVVVAFDEPLDHALVQRWVWVEDAAGVAVPGHARVDGRDTTWSFVPSDDWRPGRYVVRVRAALEDRAGNRFDRPFDREAGTSSSSAPADGGVLPLAFEVGAR